MSRIKRSERKNKKYKVTFKGKTVHFGDPNLKIKRNNPKRRKAFNNRFNCDNPGPKTKARYWSCLVWKPSTKLP